MRPNHGYTNSSAATLYRSRPAAKRHPLINGRLGIFRAPSERTSFYLGDRTYILNRTQPSGSKTSHFPTATHPFSTEPNVNSLSLFLSGAQVLNLVRKRSLVFLMCQLPLAWQLLPFQHDHGPNRSG